VGILDDEGRVQVRLICNRCGTVLDSEILPPIQKRANPIATRREAEAEAADGI
jgi:hypothetical protein